MCEIVGGIYVIGTDQIDTVIYGGNSVVVGQKAIDAMQDRAIYLKADLTVLDHKKLLGIIGMSQPVCFGTINSDDGETSFVVSRKTARVTPSEKLIEDLNARLSMTPDKIIELLIRDFKLNESVWMAMGGAVYDLIEKINTSITSRGKPLLKTILIATSLGELIPFVKSNMGSEHTEMLEVATDAKPRDPKTYKDLMAHLFDLAVKNKAVSSSVDIECKMPDVPEYPKLTLSLAPIALSEQKDVIDYVKAIITRENELTPHLVAIEKYNVEVAHGIQAYMKHILMYFTNPDV